MVVPCGRCIGCRLDRSRDWATRIANEASLHECNSFLTLTYDDEHLPDDYSVRVRDLQLFMKRLRKAISPTKCRFFACGEYGEENGRPHYHVILFGYDFPDGVPWRKSKTGFIIRRSAQLEQLWPFGYSEVGTVTSASGGYVARYVLKKVGGVAADEHYQRLHPLTGEICWVSPEFAVMSTKPGIGRDWFERYEKDAFPSDFLVVDGKKVPIPKYYGKQLKDRYENEGSDPTRLVPVDDLKPITRKRKVKARENAENSTPERLNVRHESAQLKQARFTRDLGE